MAISDSSALVGKRESVRYSGWVSEWVSDFEYIEQLVVFCLGSMNYIVYRSKWGTCINSLEVDYNSMKRKLVQWTTCAHDILHVDTYCFKFV